MIETVAIQDEMTQQTSLLDHSEEQVQQEMETITKMHMGPVIHRKYQQNQTMEKQKRYTLYQSHHCRTQEKNHKRTAKISKSKCTNA